MLTLLRTVALGAVVLTGLLGCATTGPAQPAAASASTVAPTPVQAPASGAAVAAAPPGAAASGARPPGAAPVATLPTGPLRPFADVIKDAKRMDGVLTVWQKDDKVWLELKPSDLDKPFFLSPKLKSGIAERRLYGGAMEDSGIVEFRRVYNQMQLVWKNIGYYAAAGSAEARSVASSYSPSLLASAPVLSLPEPDRKSVLVEANALFLNDLLAIGMDLQRAYRQGYSFDARNSALTSVRVTPEIVVIEVLSHFATASIAVPQPGTPPGVPQPSAPRTLPDPRSMFFQLHYSLARLPEQPMKGRKSDPRIGYFESGRYDFTSDLPRTARTKFVNRWRLEKKDADAALSEPVKPIVYWLDKSIPPRYRAPISAGILEWNKAFEKIGFKNAIEVKVQPDDADFDTLDFGRASIRWLTSASPSFGGIGPSHADPRSGEILDAVIGLESLTVRNVRTQRSQILANPLPGALFDALPESPEERRLALAGRLCEIGGSAFEQMSYALEVLEARGDIAPDSPEAEAFVAAMLKDVTMHEVGHTLGLRHNFRSSRVYTLAQLADPAFVRANGLTGSVMDYAPINLNLPGEPMLDAGAAFGETLGPYDYWAIEYAYKPLPSGISARDEAAALEKIAGRSAEPLLAYGTDEDNFIGIDPESLQFDLGNDPVAFAKKRVAIAQDLLQRQERRQLVPTDDYSLLRRAVSYALRDVARSAGVLARQIGGVRTVRDAPGTGRDPLAAVPAAEQRQALDVITGSLLSADSFRISPALQRKLGADFGERTDAFFGGEGSTQTDYSPSVQVLGMQRALLAQLMSDSVATRMLESAERSPDGASRSLRMPELYTRLTQAVWSELDGKPADIAPLRREVQRDHINRIAALLLRPGASSRADTRGVVRGQATALLTRVRAAGRRGGLGEETRAHLVDSADTLEQALNARLQRVGA